MRESSSPGAATVEFNSTAWSHAVVERESSTTQKSKNEGKRDLVVSTNSIIGVVVEEATYAEA
eukprot:scaffold519051_cov110-Attheya_sp.AAC.1